MEIFCPYSETKCKDSTCPCAKFYAYQDVQDPQKIYSILKNNNFDTSLPAWELMYCMQRSFAQRLHKIDDLTKNEMDNWIDKYLVCIEDEIREVREYLNLYDQPVHTSEQELKKEVIDILHFMMDLFICGGASAQDIKQTYIHKYLNTSVEENEDLITLAYKLQSKDVEKYLNIYSIDKKDWSILKAVCKLSDAGAQVRQQISWKHWKKPNDSINKEKLYDAFALVFHEFINLSILVMKYNEIKEIYVKKNVENIQRQFYGY